MEGVPAGMTRRAAHGSSHHLTGASARGSRGARRAPRVPPGPSA
jgi:hypothetical protein